MDNWNYLDHCYKHICNHNMANYSLPLPVGSHSMDNFMAYSYNLDYFCDSLVSHSVDNFMAYSYNLKYFCGSLVSHNLDHIMANDDHLANMCVPVGSLDMDIFISSDFTLNTLGEHVNTGRCS